MSLTLSRYRDRAPCVLPSHPRSHQTPVRSGVWLVPAISLSPWHTHTHTHTHPDTHTHCLSLACARALSISPLFTLSPGIAIAPHAYFRHVPAVAKRLCTQRLVISVSLSLSLFLSLTHTHTLSLSLSLTHTHIHTLALSLARVLSLSFLLTLSLPVSRSRPMRTLVTSPQSPNACAFGLRVGAAGMGGFPT